MNEIVTRKQGPGEDGGEETATWESIKPWLQQVEREDSKVLLCAFSSPSEAGAVGSLVADQLLRCLPHELVAEINLDSYVDYTAGRQQVLLSHEQIKGVSIPACGIYQLRDFSGRQFMLLRSQEPSFRWLSLLRKLGGLVDSYGVDEIVSVMGVGSNTPHTRPSLVAFLSSDEKLTRPLAPGLRLPSEYVINASFQLYLHKYVADRFPQISSRIFMAGVPEYAHGLLYSPAALACLDELSYLYRLRLPVGDLQAQKRELLAQLNRNAEFNAEFSQAVKEWEVHYDRVVGKSTVDFSSLQRPLSPDDLDFAALHRMVDGFLAENESPLVSVLATAEPGVTVASPPAVVEQEQRGPEELLLPSRRGFIPVSLWARAQKAHLEAKGKIVSAPERGKCDSAGADSLPTTYPTRRARREKTKRKGWFWRR